jgi:hypothetical protein
MLHIYLHTNKTLTHNSLYVFDNWFWNLGDDHQLSPLMANLGIPCLIWEPPQLLLFTVCTCV